MNIYLIGYRCTGKTTVGKILANRIGSMFIDTDILIVIKQGMPISEIVKKYGWEYFRELEKKMISRISSGDDQVVSTGGGIILDKVNIDYIKKSGIAVWLKAKPETIEKRITKDKSTGDFRPSLTSKELKTEIRETLEERIPLYQETMNFFVETDKLDSGEICDIIIQKLNLA